MTDQVVEGGCLCGAVRYRIARLGDDVAHCHCRICRRASGAAFVTWATVARDDLEVRGRVRWFRSSRLALRGSCPVCGSQLFFAQEVDESAATVGLPLADPPPADPRGTAMIDLTVATLDDPDRARPSRNIWVGSRLAWLHGFDANLPDHRDEGVTVPPAGDDRID